MSELEKLISTENFIVYFEQGKEDKDYSALQNIHAATSYLHEDDILIILNRLKLMDYTVKNSFRVRGLSTPKNLTSTEIERIKAEINLKRARRGFFAELLLKYHQVVESRGDSEKKTKSLLQRFFGL